MVTGNNIRRFETETKSIDYMICRTVLALIAGHLSN